MSELLSVKKVCDLFGVSRSTLDRYREDPNFPKPASPPGHHPRWSRADIERFLGYGGLASIAMDQAQSALPDIDLSTLSPEEIRTRLVAWHAESARKASSRGDATVAALFSKVADALRAAGPRI